MPVAAGAAAFGCTCNNSAVGVRIVDSGIDGGRLAPQAEGMRLGCAGAGAAGCPAGGLAWGVLVVTIVLSGGGFEVPW